MTVYRAVRLRRGTLVLGASFIAMGSAGLSPALAQCSPDPTVAGGTTSCSGTDADGVIIGTNNSSVEVQAGASVLGTGGPAITVGIPVLENYYGSRYARIDVAGTVDGGAEAGILVLSGPLGATSSDYYGADVAIRVEAGATVTGGTGIRVTRSSGNTFGAAIARIDNAGEISGTGGLALASGDSRASLQVVNRATGTVGAIDGPLVWLDNAGTIDGGSSSAIAGGVSPAAQYSREWVNSGTIRSASTSATVQGLPQDNPFVNSGTITNTGSGAALSVTALSLTNTATGTILAAGDVAIEATAGLRLINAGRIEGDVLAGTTGFSVGGSFVDSTAGVIDGDLVFAEVRPNVFGNVTANTLVARYSGAGSLITGVTGSITGSGVDELLLRVDADTSIDNAIPLFSGFDRLQVEVQNSATAVLGTDFTAPGSLKLSGTGTVINRGTLVADGQVLGDNPGGTLRIVNEGTIRSNPAAGNIHAIRLNLASLTNAGLIQAAANGVTMDNGDFANSGEIIAGGTAVTSRGYGFSNDGTIRSTDGTGLSLAAWAWQPGATPTNRGLIEGASRGVELSSVLTNAGTIRSDNVAVAMNGGSRIENSAGGIITGGTQAIAAGLSDFNRTVVNAGTINGDVDLGNPYGLANTGNRYFALSGGVLNGNLRLGSGDALVTELVNDGTGQFAGITGMVTGNGAHLRYQVQDDAAAVHTPVEGFASVGYQVLDGAALTLTNSSGTSSQQILLAGTGSVDLALDIETADRAIVQATSLIHPDGYNPVGELAIVNRGTLSTTHRADDPFGTYAAIENFGARFTNAGTINVRELTAPTANSSRFPSSATRGGVVINEGAINLAGATGVLSASSLVNTGTIAQIAGTAAATGVQLVSRVENSGTIRVDGVAIANFASYSVAPLYLTNTATGIIASTSGTAVRSGGGSVANAGTITGTVDLGYTQDFSGTPARTSAAGSYIAAGGTVSGDVLFGRGSDLFIQEGETSGVAGLIDGGEGANIYIHQVAASRTVNLRDDRVIGFRHLAVNVTPADAVATLAGDQSFAGTLTLQGAGTVVNDGTIEGLLTTYVYYPLYNVLDGYSSLARLDNRGTISGEISGIIGTLVNSGRIDGRLTLDVVPTRVENRGTIAGTARLTGGDDTFVQYGSGTLSAVVDGRSGNDLFVMAADTAGAISADRITRFERAMQTGTETIAWSGDFSLPTIELEGGTLAVRAGGSLSSTGPVTITGGDAGVTVRNEGTIAGAVVLGAGSDRYVEGPGAVAASVDGGAGINTYGVLLAGDRGGIAARSNFQRLAVEGTGTLSLALDQDFAGVELAGTGLVATLNGYAIDRIDGSTAAERVAVDGDVATVALGDGDDLLSLGSATLAGAYAGGAGSDTLRLTAAGPVVLSGTATGFELLQVDEEALSVSGTLGTAGDTLTFGRGAQRVTLAAGGTLAGTINLGDGDDRFRLDRGGILAGTLSGGAGTNTAELDVTAGMVLAGSLRDFAQVATAGSGTLTIARGASLQTPQLLLGTGTGRLVIDGQFAGGIRGAGTGHIVAVSGGSGDRPAAFTDLTGIAGLEIAGGWTTLAGSATLGRLAMSGGRLVGLAGSTLSAAQIDVGTGATFGSAGTINGNIAIAGMLNPGASPGTMVVNGNIALAATSTSVFEITPIASDLLTINGALAIAPGATLELVADQRVTPGQSLDLITATGGITGSFTSVRKPAALFGFVVQEDDRIALIGAFLNDPAFVPPVQGAITYVNDLLTAGLGSPALLSALPLLIDAQGGASAAAFARLTPQSYAAATQLVVEQGLELARAARGDAFAAPGDTPRPFAFAAALGRTDELAGGPGLVRARSDSYGVIGGVGWGSRAFSVGAFVGTLDQRQDLRTLGARTDADGLVAGLHARWRGDALGVKASIAYADGDATTTRLVPGGRATGGYDLTGWTADLMLDYDVALGDGWTVRPGIGATAIRATRQRTAESGDTPFLLDVARDRYNAVFVDGGVTMMRDRTATIRPHLAAGLRYRIDGDRPEALAALPGGPLTLSGYGAARSALTAHGALGAEASVTRNLTLFGSVAGEAGEDTSQGSGQLGLRVAF